VNPFTAQGVCILRGIVPLVKDQGEVLDMSVGEFTDSLDGAADGSGKHRCARLGASVEFVDERQAKPLDDAKCSVS